MKPLYLKVTCPSCGFKDTVPTTRTKSGYVPERKTCSHCSRNLETGGSHMLVEGVVQEEDAGPSKPMPKPFPRDEKEEEEEPQESNEEGGHGPTPYKDAEEEAKRTLALMPPPDAVFTAKLKSIMRDNKFDRKIPNRKRGRLDMKRLFRAELGKENLFTQKLARKNKEFHVKLLVDTSGSMGGSKIERACEMAQFLALSLKKAGINFSVDTFNFYYKHVLTENQSPLNLANTIYAQFQDDCHGNLQPAGENHDAMAVRTALHELDKHKFGKLLIVFSDGEPAVGDLDANFKHRPDQIKEDKKKGFEVLISPEGRALPIGEKDDYERSHYGSFKAVENEVKKVRSVQTLGVGVISEAPTHIYPNSIVVNDLTEFKSKVIDAIKPLIKRA